ncbi:MAG: efflux RND transporter periplasmic adaptor subunit [candidate division KSB1 bacterium]|nr:efflux RND transporter periplasmic adaptor subunit [candidate division KSB1 bacterium]MDZ7302192.1 efflux RND transporter periplasmic adaptor subunit [candidate division KSB1 bacterium]MDZ7311301.1 efflux RND transporter periplasmic adaptor subunit [candidate division KSB1 bacterium]
MRSGIIQPTILIIFAALLFVACGKEAQTASEKPEPVVHVKTAPVSRQDMVDTLNIFGTVALRQEAFLASQFDGRLTDFSLLLGDHVKKGEQIGTIVPAEREALLQVTNQMPVEMRPLLEQQIKTIPLYSPLDGVVLEVLHHTGDVVQKGEQIVHLGDLSVLDVRGDLPVRYLPLLRRSGKIRVTFVDYPHAPLSLPLEVVSGKINTDNQTVVIRLALANPNGEFRPGMLARLTFPSETHANALTIPRPALLEEEGVFHVFVLQENKVEKRAVKVGILHDDHVEILAGVNENERVVTEKAYSLEDGMEVVAE